VGLQSHRARRLAEDKDVVWTVTLHGVTLKAYGSLWPVWEVDEKIMSSDNGGRTARTSSGNRKQSRPHHHGDLARFDGAAGTPLTLTPVDDRRWLAPTPAMRGTPAMVARPRRRARGGRGARARRRARTVCGE